MKLPSKLIVSDLDIEGGVRFAEIKKLFLEKKLLGFNSLKDVMIVLPGCGYSPNLPLKVVICSFLSRKTVLKIGDKTVKVGIFRILKYLGWTVISPIFSIFSLALLYAIINICERLVFKRQTQTVIPKQVLYLRTDLIFGLKAGGSVTHISGVLNAIQNRLSCVFYSTDVIPGIVPEQRQEIFHSRPFTSISPELARGLSSFQQVNELRCLKKPYDTVYQRYSLNNFTGVLLSLFVGKHQFILEYNGSEIWMSENWGSQLKFRRIAERIELLNLTCADKIVVVSKAMCTELVSRGVNEDKILVNPNGVDLDAVGKIETKNIVADRFRFGFVGTFGPWHGVLDSLIAYQSLCNTSGEFRSKTEYHLVGTGVEIEKCMCFVEAAGLQDNVVFHGTLAHKEALAVLNSCNCFLAPTKPNDDGTEFIGSPTKIFEYMALGRPIIATAVNQVVDILTHMDSAILTEPKSKQSLSEAIRWVFENQELAFGIGLQARQLAYKKYSWHAHTDKIFGI